MFELADTLVGIYKTYNATKTVTVNPALYVAHGISRALDNEKVGSRVRINFCPFFFHQQYGNFVLILFADTSTSRYMFSRACCNKNTALISSAARANTRVSNLRRIHKNMICYMSFVNFILFIGFNKTSFIWTRKC